MRRPSRWARECREWKLGSHTHDSAQSFRSENPPLQKSSACRRTDVLVRFRVRSGRAEQRCGNGSNLGRRCRSRGATRDGASGSAVERRSSKSLNGPRSGSTTPDPPSIRGQTCGPRHRQHRSRRGQGRPERRRTRWLEGFLGSSGGWFMPARCPGRCHGSGSTRRAVAAPAGGPGPLQAPRWLDARRPRASRSLGKAGFCGARRGRPGPEPTAAPGAVPAFIRNNNIHVDFCAPSGYNRVDVKGCVYERRWRTKRALPSPPAMCFGRGS